MFGIGGFELFIILIFGFLIFGPDKLPDIAKTVGKGIARFRQAQDEMTETLGGETLFDPNNPDEPFKDPVEVLDKIAKKQEEKKAAQEKSQVKSQDTPKGAESDASDKADGENDGEEPRRAETFTERKARYERERAARKAAEAEAAAAKDAPADGGDAAAEVAEAEKTQDGGVA